MTPPSRVILVVEDRSHKVVIRAGVASADSGSDSVSLPSRLSTWSLLSINGGFLIRDESYLSVERLPNSFGLMHRFVYQIEHFTEVNRLMGVPYAAAKVAPENLGLAPHSRSFDPQNDMRIKDQNSFIADEAQSGFAVGDRTGGCSGHGGGERIAWQSNGDEAAVGRIARVGGGHGDLDCGGAHRHIDEDRIVFEIDFMAAAVRAA